MGFNSDIPFVTNQLQLNVEVPQPGDENFLPYMTQYLRRITDSMNTKGGSLFMLQELATFQQWFTRDEPFRFRGAYRMTYDLTALLPVPGNIPIGITNKDIPVGEIQYITGIKVPVNGFGAAIGTDNLYYFINDPNLYIRFDNTNVAFQRIIINNTTGVAMTTCIWCMEYLKVE